MADNGAAANDDDDDVFIYMGGDQEVPDNTTHLVVDKSVKFIPRYVLN